MPFRRAIWAKLWLGLGTASVGLLAGCGGGSLILPHPTGNYSNASLNGAYAFEMHGMYLPSTGSQFNLYRESGILVADGAGHISSASVDDFSTGSLATNSISGSYTVAKDGTGFITLNATGLGQASGSSSVTWAVTLISPQKLYLMEADSFADGAGTAELEDPSATGSIPTGTFVFRLHELSSTAQGLNTTAQVGVMTLSSTGAVSGGSMDQNLNGTVSSLTFNGTIQAPSSGRGTGTLTDSSGAQTSLTYYIVNGQKLDLLVEGSGSMGLGNAELQTGSIASGFSGIYAFGSRGDTSSIDGAETVGEFTASGATVSSGLLDSVQDGNYSAAVSYTGSPSGASPNPSPQGRVQIALSTGTVQDFWMVSPSRAFFLDESTGRVEDGTADLETTSSFSVASFNGQFALVMDGFDQLPEVLARVGTLQLDGTSRLTLVELVNGTGSLAGAQSPGTMGGNYQVSGRGRIAATLGNSGGGFDVVMYPVSGSDAYVLQSDPGTNTSGTIELQH